MQNVAESYVHSKSAGFTLRAVHRSPPRVITAAPSPIASSTGSPAALQPAAKSGLEVLMIPGWPRTVVAGVAVAILCAAVLQTPQRRPRHTVIAMPRAAATLHDATPLPTLIPNPVIAPDNLSINTPDSKPQPPGEATGIPRTSGPATAPGRTAILALLPREQADQVAVAGTAALFASHSWNPPAPPPVAVVKPPPPKPTAPPLPFTYLGKMLDAGVWETYLARGEETFVVRQHAQIDANYRVESIVPPNMTITYLPLKQVQTLSIGDQ